MARTDIVIDDSGNERRPRMSRIVLCLIGALLSLSSAAPGAQGRIEWPTFPIKSAPAELRPSIQYGDLIILSIQNAVLSELVRELTDGGPERAIRVCHMSATTVANQIAREEGVHGGRTSARLRTLSNAPRPWAAPIVARFAQGRAAATDGFVADLGTRVGVMRPIAYLPVCAPCHGAGEQLTPQVRAELKNRYPQDRATGFKEGDLRGWLWVEVPKK
jgi:hypothetical protein